MSGSNSEFRRRIALGLLLLAGCEGPWNGLPSGEAYAPRASVAVFLQAGHPSIATFARPLAEKDNPSRVPPWIDQRETRVEVVSSDSRCTPVDSLEWRDIVYSSTYRVGWEKSLESAGPEPGRGCPDSLAWIRGHLKWNPSLPWDSAGQWTTDSFLSPVQVSTKPSFRRGPILVALDLVWPELAEADGATRVAWASSPSALKSELGNWQSFRRRIGLDTQVLVRRRDGLYHKVALDTGTLAAALRRSPRLGIFVPSNPGDTLFLLPGAESYVIPAVQGAEGLPFYIATSTGDDLASIPFAQWDAFANWTTLLSPTGDPVQDWFPVYRSDDGSFSRFARTGLYGIQLAVAGTCPGQRAWLAGGSSTRGQTPRGNMAPLDGFACRVSIDTLSFPLAW